MKRIFVVIFVFMLLLVWVNVSFAQNKKYRFGLALQTLQIRFWLSLAAAAKKEAAKYDNVELIVVGAEHSTDLTTQVKQVEDFIQMKMDCIGLVPVERRGILPTLEKCAKAGIPVITVDTDSDGGKRECYIATNQVLGGSLAGQWIVRNTHGKKKLAILEGAPGSMNNHYRLQGFKPEIQKAPRIQIVSSLTAKWRRDEGMRVMNDILTAHPDLDIVMAMNDEMILGAMEALRSRGKLQKIMLVGYNGDPEAIQQVFRGNMAADVVQFPERVGELFIQNALLFAQGGKLPTDLPKMPTNPPTYHIDSGVSVVDSRLLSIAVGPALKEISGELKDYVKWK